MRYGSPYGLGLLLAFDVSLGFNGVIYPALYDYFLPFKALRDSGADGADGRLLAGDAGGVRRGADRRTLRIGERARRC
jgi:hypothetical protein